MLKEIKIKNESARIITLSELDKIEEASGAYKKDFWFNGALRGGTVVGNYWYTCCSPRNCYKVKIAK